MTHIEQMIQDMCPNGVEWKTLGEVTKIIRGERVTKSQLISDGKYPVVSGGVNPMGYIDKYNREANTITIAQYGTAGYVNYITEKFWANDVCYSVYPSDRLLNRFLYYYLEHKQGYFYSVRNTDAIPYSIALEKIQSLKTPLPPIEIQEKIVECLDKFSALAAELQAELQMRRKQYEYYRTHLLTPHSDCNSADNTDDCNWEWKTLGEICDLVKERVSAAELNENNYVGVENLLSNKQGKIPSVSVPTTGNVIKFSKDNILIGNIRPYLRKIWFADCDGGTNGDVITLEIKDKYQNMILPKFLYHALADERFFIYDTQYSSGAKMPRGDKDKVMEYKIPLPPLAEQKRIANLLDKFEALTTSLSDGIPAEQAAQQKRYEYYRDLLLTFPRKEV